MTDCVTCRGARWMCETHTDTPWTDEDYGCPKCDGAGLPCPTCNTDDTWDGEHES